VRQSGVRYHASCLSAVSPDVPTLPFTLCMLGMSGSRKGDDVTARACLERHLKLSDTLDDKRGSADACRELGFMSLKKGEYDEASRYFESALVLAQEMEEEKKEVELKCQIGVARGTVRLDEMKAQLQAIVESEMNEEAGM